ncbi:glycosyltransferase [Rhizobium sp. R72]|uniref:CgeB family protein n=1 Tax=unclassified Rhizobium TaxID=2613769 RepID=UPI000B538446|nr:MULTISPECIES: glycosyltransferase [unclassified Rhizobium]OWV92802.1 glycosyltransferase [Rhizobium sp. R72]OWV93013.1 glycosyltransferase [Rhizobium sp. R711]
MKQSLNVVVLGLSLSSSWGNGHATTYRALLRGMHAEGHRVLFLERDVSWYAKQRDLPDPSFCELSLYNGVDDLLARSSGRLHAADAVLIGSYVPEGIRIIDAIARQDPKLLCFYDIDTPVTLANLDRGDEDYIAARQMPLFDIYFSFAGGEVIDRLEQHYGVSHAEPLFCCVDAQAYQNTGEPRSWDLGYIGTYSIDRQPALERLLIEPARLLPDMRFVVAGPNYPAHIDWPANVERIEHLAPSDHPSFYSRQRFTLNITRADMAAAGWSPSVRLFEAAACGTPIISDYWNGLGDFFPLREAIIVACDPADVVSALTKVSFEAQGRIAQAARRIVLHQHTGRARATQLAASLCSARQRNRPRRSTGFRTTA